MARSSTTRKTAAGARRVDRPSPDGDLIPVERREEIPDFKDEDEEAEFWATHAIAGALLERMQPVRLDDPDFPPARSPSAAPTRAVSVRLDDDVLRRLKAVAAKKRKGYQTLLKEFLVERLREEEQRQGLRA